MSCPICGKAGVVAYRPFCSKRCADIDLARWLNEDYRVPGPEEEDSDGLASTLSGSTGPRPS
jgi:endogenous inhibitor of DNA gyrase (YacG/DUF329 family)